MIDEYEYVKKTPETRDELIKIQTERLKVLNKEVRELKAEQKRTYREMMYFKNQSKKKQNKINKAIDILEHISITIMPNNMIIHGTELNNKLKEIYKSLKGDDR